MPQLPPRESDRFTARAGPYGNWEFAHCGGTGAFRIGAKCRGTAAKSICSSHPQERATDHGAAFESGYVFDPTGGREESLTLSASLQFERRHFYKGIYDAVISKQVQFR